MKLHRPKTTPFDGEDMDEVVKGVAIGVGIALLTKVAEWIWERCTSASRRRKAYRELRKTSKNK